MHLTTLRTVHGGVRAVHRDRVVRRARRVTTVHNRYAPCMCDSAHGYAACAHGYAPCITRRHRVMRCARTSTRRALRAVHRVARLARRHRPTQSEVSSIFEDSVPPAPHWACAPVATTQVRRERTPTATTVSYRMLRERRSVCQGEPFPCERVGLPWQSSF